MQKKFKEKLSTFIKIYNIPIEEKWLKYLKDDHYNYFIYLEGLSLVEKAKVIKGNIDSYKIEYNRSFNNFFLKNEYHFETKNLEGKTVIDVGCGWGFLALWYALSGAKIVYAIGFPYQIEFIVKLLSRAKEKGLLEDSVKIVGISKPLEKGNTTIGDLESMSVDYVFSLRYLNTCPIPFSLMLLQLHLILLRKAENS